MVLPIRPGVSRSWKRRTPSSSGGSIQTWEFSQTGNRQARPYSLPLPATMLSFGVLSSYRSTREGGYQTPAMDSGQAYSVRRDWLTNPRTYQDAYNRAYASFKDQVYSSASVGVSLAEARQSVSMIAARASQLYQFSRYVRRLDFDAAARILGMSAAPKSYRRYGFHRGDRRKKRNLDVRPGGRDLGNTWLEFHFGWAPLVKDIYDACEVLSNPVPADRVMARAKARGKDISNISSGYERTSSVSSYSISSKLGAYITVDNPNLLLASRLGLVNPAIIAWELVPFSFVVDWFVNVGDFLSSYTDFYGLRLSSAYHSKFSRSNWSDTYLYSFPGYENTRVRNAACVRFERSDGIGPGPFLKAMPPKQISVSRGATAISLLLQQLR